MSPGLLCIFRVSSPDNPVYGRFMLHVSATHMSAVCAILFQLPETFCHTNLMLAWNENIEGCDSYAQGLIYVFIYAAVRLPLFRPLLLPMER